MKNMVITALLGAAITLHAGFFDSLPSAQELTGAKQSESAIQNGLLSTITGSLGVTNEQAAGGTAALMQAAASKMPSPNYNEILKKVPGLDSITGKNGGMIGSAAAFLGSSDNVSKAFKSLGMDGSMAEKFIPLILQYSEKYVDKENLSLLKSALRSVL